MRLAAVYSFNRGKETVSEKYPDLLVEINDCIKAVEESQHSSNKNLGWRCSLEIVPSWFTAGLPR